MFKKTHLQDLSVDSIVIAEIVEAISDKHFIVNFNGALVRVENQTPVPLRRKQRVSLRVTSVMPLSFQLYKAEARNKFDFTI